MTAAASDDRELEELVTFEDTTVEGLPLKLALCAEEVGGSLNYVLRLYIVRVGEVRAPAGATTPILTVPAAFVTRPRVKDALIALCTEVVEELKLEAGVAAVLVKFKKGKRP